MKNKKVLIVGNLFALAKRLSKEAEKVFAAPGSFMMQEFAECVDIREENPAELLDFVLENDIDLTIAVSDKAISNDIASLFQANGKLIFAPAAKSADFVINKASGKRFLYKLHAPTSRFGIFEKLPFALEYLENAAYPLIVGCGGNNCNRPVCTNLETAKSYVEELFASDIDKILIEEYVFGHEFTMYFITDGYQALPLPVTANYKLDGETCLLTSGVGAYVPDYKVSNIVQTNLLKNVVIRALEALQKKGTPYLGILGVDAVLTAPDTFVVSGFKPFMSDVDAQAVLNSTDENLIDLFEACANGAFSDDYENILTNDNSSVSCLVKSKNQGKIIPNLDVVDSEISYLNTRRNEYFEYIADKGNNFVLTSCAKTLTRAKSILEDDLKLIEFDGIKYSRDIYKS